MNFDNILQIFYNTDYNIQFEAPMGITIYDDDKVIIREIIIKDDILIVYLDIELNWKPVSNCKNKKNGHSIFE